MTYWFSRAITLFLTFSLSLSYTELSPTPLFENWASHILANPFISYSSDFPINCCRYTSKYFYFSLFFKETELTRYLDRGFPSRRVFRSKFRTRFFSHWRLHHLCRFRDYFCRFVLSGHPIERQGRGERDVGENSEREKEKPRSLERSRYNGEQHYWLFKMVFTENNQSEGIMAQLVTLVCVDRPPISLLFHSRESPTIVYIPTLRLIIFRLIDIETHWSFNSQLSAVANLSHFNYIISYIIILFAKHNRQLILLYRF